MDRKTAVDVTLAVVITLILVTAGQWVFTHLRWVNPAPPPAPKPVVPPVPPAPPPAPTPKPFPSTSRPWRSIVADHEHAHLCGWIPDHPSRPAVAASLPTLIQAGPRLVADANQNVFLWKVWGEVFSGLPDYPAQQIGDCVSFGHGHGHDLLMTIEAYLGDLPVDSIHRTCTEFIYGESRKVGGMLGGMDGSYGSAAIKAMTTVGMVPYSVAGGSYSGQRAKQWGRTGPPSALEAAAGQWKLGAGALVDSTDAAIAALQAGHPFTICTGQGFTMARDSQGFCKPRGSWGHCMLVSGYRSDRPGFLINQSWGPNRPSGPTAFDQPTWSFWCDLQPMARILSEGDSWALSGSPGFAPRSLPGALLS